MEDDEIRGYIAQTLDVSVSSGYGTKEDVCDALVEQVREEFRERPEEEVEVEVRRWIDRLDVAWAAQRASEAGWPDETMNDRIDRAFEELTEHGVVALQDAGYTLSDGWSDVHEAAPDVPRAWGGVFFHRQDVERGVEGDGLMLAFGAFVDGAAHEAESLRLARLTCAVLERHGVPTTWDGTLERRIAIDPFPWQRRRPRTPTDLQ